MKKTKISVNDRIKVLPTWGKVVGGIAIFLIAIMIFAAMGGDDEIRKELDIDTATETEAVETETDDVSQDEFINELYTRILKFEAESDLLAVQLVELGNDVSLFDSDDFIADINGTMDNIITIVQPDTVVPGDKDGEEAAASYYLDFKEHETNFINALRTGVNENDLEAMTLAFEHQTEAMTYFETVTKSLAIAMENKADK